MSEIKKVLVIEDDSAMAKALEIKLVHAGFEVKITGNGEEGQAVLKKEDFSLVLLDLVMPKLDGFDVLEKLKEKGSKTPVIVLSNLSHPDDEKRARELGAADFLIKSNTPIAIIVERVKEKLADSL